MSKTRLPAQEFRRLFVNDLPMMDLRSPCEFVQGAFPQAVNLPLMSDEERAKVGTCYKRKGKDAAIALGHRLVSGAVKAERLARWLEFATEHPHGYLYCFRGGLRSQTVQAWMSEAGVDYPLITGGYKALRRFLMAETVRLTNALPIYILSGYTGVGKTRLLNQFSQALDLEGLANHRGSSFGRQLTPQPSQIDFENQLAQRLIQHEDRQQQFLVLEDESRLIGARSVPLELHAKMKQSPLIILEASFEARVENIFQEYVIERFNCYQTAAYAEPVNALADYLYAATSGIQKRLGGERYSELRRLIHEAVKSQAANGDCQRHYAWIQLLLREYYDPMYQYQLNKKRERVVFVGDSAAVAEFVNQRSVNRTN